MKKAVKAVIAAVILCACIAAAVFAVKHFAKEEPPEASTSEGSQGPAVSERKSYKYKNTEFRFSELFSYCGEYVEDGSDEPENNVAAIRIKNVSGKACRYAVVKAMTGDGDFEFEFTTLKDGEVVTVLEKNRKHLTKQTEINSISVENKVWFEEEPELFEDAFELTVFDKVINIKNISGRDIDGVIYVYYKNTDENGFLGGITYRVPFDSLKAGELKQASSKHLSKQNSVMEFITYEH